MSVEIELKLAIAPDAAARLRRHPLLRASKAVKTRLYGIYYDTPDLDLYKKRHAIRLRREGQRWVQTLKLDTHSAGGLSTRPEWEVEVAGDELDLAALPAEARRHLDPALMASLVPVFVTDFQRHTWQLTLPAASLEVALDLGHVRAGEHDLPVAEVELELLSGDGTALFDVALALLRAVPLLPEYRSKALRGYELAGVHDMAPCPAIAADIGKRLVAGEARRRLLVAALTQLTHNLPGFLVGDDPEYLHQMRVAVRRLGTLLRLGSNLEAAPPGWLAELRWLMAELGPARDWDVMETVTLARVRSALAEPERLDALLAAVRCRRAAAHERARAAVTHRRFTRLLLEMGRNLLTTRVGGAELSIWARAALDRRWRKFKRLAARRHRLDTAGWHRLRLAAKRLRYAGEAFMPLYGRPARRFLATLARLQDRLGAANDVVIAHALLAEMGHAAEIDYGVGLVEGYLAGGASGRPKQMAARVGAMAGVKPYWR